MFEKFSRSLALIKASLSVLRQDKELLVFPAVSGIAGLLVMGSFLLPLFGLLDFQAMDRGEDPPMWLYGWVFLFYLSQYFVIFFFNTALVGAALIRLRGGDPTVRDGLDIAFSKIRVILGYALIAATVGMALRIIEEKLEGIGKFVAGAIGAAWTASTFLVVPLLVSREVGPLTAVKDSALMLKKTWGENAVGRGGVGLVFGLLQVVVIMITALAAVAMVIQFGSLSAMVAVLVIGALVFLTVLLLQTALSGIYSAALYQYASGEHSGGMDTQLLAQAFAPKS